MYSFDRIIFLPRWSHLKVEWDTLLTNSKPFQLICTAFFSPFRLPASIFFFIKCVRKELEKISTEVHTHTHKTTKTSEKRNQIISCYIWLPEFKYGFFVCSFHGTGVCEFHITGIYRAFHCHGYISSYQRSQFCDIRCPWLLEKLLNSTSNRYSMQKAPSQTMLISFSMMCVQPTSINYMCNISICVLISDFLSTAFPMPFLSHESKSLRFLRRLKMISLNEIMQSWCGFYFSFLLNYSVSHTKRMHMNDPNESCRHYNFVVFFLSFST